MQALAELDLRLANLLRYGTVTSLNEAAATVVVDLGGNTTYSLPWFTTRAGGDRAWWAPEVGEQVMVLSPSGELAHGCVLPAIYRDAHPANASSKDVRRETFADGTVIEYDRAAHQLLVNASASNGSVVVNVGSGGVTVNCSQATVNATAGVTLNTPDTHCTGALTVDGMLTFKAGMTGSGGAGNTASITGNINITSGEVTVDGIGVKAHHHTEHDGPSTSAAQA